MKNHIKIFLLGVFFPLTFTSCSLSGNISTANPKHSTINNHGKSSHIYSNKVSDRPDNGKVYIEKSVDKRDLKIYVLGKDSAKHKMAILGSIHGDEPQGKYIVEHLMEYIKTNSQIIKNKQILFIPAMNPDGLYRNTRGNANKVDLNRNFPTKNWVNENEDKHTRYYPGNKACSEPETKMIIKYIEDFKPKLIINIHSPLRVINYDGINSKKTADLMATYNKYKSVGDIGYPTPGSFGTYFGKERNIPVITLETSYGPEQEAWLENKEGILAAIRNLGEDN